ncbi:MAG: SprT-like domain-containing protein [Deltaproteobacteria bacterium]|jgi:predicted SprT family Zn-dependent metalloprotease|nr:SprT-like domain-containing protein [Deltaproteobacteria bacterium]
MLFFEQLSLWFNRSKRKTAQTQPIKIVRNPRSCRVNSKVAPATNVEAIDLNEIWQKLQQEFFPMHYALDQYQIVWSRRNNKRNLAVCDYRKKKVIVSPALNNIKFRQIVEPLVYHEMCHAVLGEPQRQNGRFVYHGKEFHSLEKRHSQTRSLNEWIKNGGWANAKRVYTRRMKKFKTA